MTFSLTKFIDTINMYYTIHDIYKSFIICNNDNDVHNVALLMENELYTVCTITLNDISLDNTNLYNNKLAYFNSIKYRVMIISYDVWELLRNELEINILPEQNLIILYLILYSNSFSNLTNHKMIDLVILFDIYKID